MTDRNDMGAPAFTPGPWKHVPWQIVEGEDEVRAPEGWLICSTSSGANARLIAAAPGLYDMLTIAARTLEIINETLAEHGMGPSKQAQDVIDCSRQILAKARG